MANQWLRLWHDMPNDPKWRTIARLSKQPIATVMAVYLHLLVTASLSSERGELKINEEDLASALDTSSQAIKDILQAMQGRVIEDNKLMGWRKRQPLKEDGSAARAKAWREAKKQLATQPNINERPEKDTEEDKDTEIFTLSMAEYETSMLQFAMFETWRPNEEFAIHLMRMGVTADYQQIPERVLDSVVKLLPTAKYTEFELRQEMNYSASRNVLQFLAIA